jgi:L-alanine-DL-glutamate epimerase-like enolase superfamily enzyme
VKSGPAPIRSVAVAQYRLPRQLWWPVPLEDRTLSIEAIELVLVDVTAADGCTGSGYTYTLGRGGSALRALLVDEIGPQLLGQDPGSPAALWRPLWMSLQRVGRGGAVAVALAAADVALWDLAAVSAGLPLHRYLGSRHDRVEAYGSSIDLGYELDALLDTVRGHLQRGLRAVKVKVGRPLGEDLERLSAVRALIGPEVGLMVDANTGWDPPEALRRARAMEVFDLTWLEEPLDPDDERGHAELQAHTSIPIAAGETLFSIAEFARYLRAGAIRYVQPDVGRVGGITPFLTVASLAGAAGLPVAPHFLHDIHVHLLCALDNASYLEHLPLLDAVLEAPLHVAADGTVAPRDVAGTGVRFARDLLEGYRVA